jgi:hypothetical protein
MVLEYLDSLPLEEPIEAVVLKAVPWPTPPFLLLETAGAWVIEEVRFYTPNCYIAALLLNLTIRLSMSYTIEWCMFPLLLDLDCYVLFPMFLLYKSPLSIYYLLKGASCTWTFSIPWVHTWQLFPLISTCQVVNYCLRFLSCASLWWLTIWD